MIDFNDWDEEEKSEKKVKSSDFIHLDYFDMIIQDKVSKSGQDILKRLQSILYNSKYGKTGQEYVQKNQ